MREALKRLSSIDDDDDDDYIKPKKSSSQPNSQAKRPAKPQQVQQAKSQPNKPQPQPVKSYPVKVQPKKPEVVEAPNPELKKLPKFSADISEADYKKLVTYELRKSPNRQIVQAWSAMSHGIQSSYMLVNLSLTLSTSTAKRWQQLIRERKITPNTLIGLWGKIKEQKALLAINEDDYKDEDDR